MQIRLFGVVGLAALTLAGATALPAAAADISIFPTHATGASTSGVDGVLRAGSPWGPGSTPSSVAAPLDGVFAPEGQQWNNGSFWWDQDPSVNSSPVSYTVILDGSYTIDHFIIQSDDNDALSIQYWNGSTYLSAWTVPLAGSFGLVTRDSGIIAPITTTKLRITGTTPSDGYYAVSEFEAFGVAAGGGVPEPATWGLMIAGFGGVGAVLRRRRQATLTSAA